MVKDRSKGELKSVEIGMDPSQNTDSLVAIDLSHRNHTVQYELYSHESYLQEYSNKNLFYSKIEVKSESDSGF